MKKVERRVVVAGCRDYSNYEEASAFIDACLQELKEEYEIIIVSGGAVGADALGERYAAENGLKLERHPADWKTYGRSAGPIRNRQMAELCDYAVCFWDGESRGTKSMIDSAKKCGKTVFIKEI